MALHEGELFPPRSQMKHLEKLRHTPESHDALDTDAYYKPWLAQGLSHMTTYTQLLNTRLSYSKTCAHHSELLCSTSVHYGSSGLFTLALDVSRQVYSLWFS